MLLSLAIELMRSEDHSPPEIHDLVDKRGQKDRPKDSFSLIFLDKCASLRAGGYGFESRYFKKSRALVH